MANSEIPIRSEADIIQLVQDDPWMMDVLRAAQTLDLPDWWIGAGFLRNRVWDAMEGNDSSLAADVDLVYFSAHDTAREIDRAYEEQLKHQFPSAEWEIKNQARMHHKNGLQPYTSTTDGIAHWTETATCVAVKLVGTEIKLLFCYGTDDLLGLIARPTPHMYEAGLLDLFHQRITEKKWQERWPDLRIETDRNALPLRTNCEGYFTDGAGNILARPSDKGYLIFPGGGVEPGEDIGVAMARETLEETGAKVSISKELGQVSYIWPEDWAQTDKQRARYLQFRGDEMHFFAGTITGFTEVGSEEDAWPEPKLMPLSEAIAFVEHMQPFPPAQAEYYSAQLEFLRELQK